MLVGRADDLDGAERALAHEADLGEELQMQGAQFALEVVDPRLLLQYLQLSLVHFYGPRQAGVEARLHSVHFSAEIGEQFVAAGDLVARQQQAVIRLAHLAIHGDDGLAVARLFRLLLVLGGKARWSGGPVAHDLLLGLQEKLALVGLRRVGKFAACVIGVQADGRELHGVVEAGACPHLVPARARRPEHGAVIARFALTRR